MGYKEQRHVGDLFHVMKELLKTFRFCGYVPVY